MRLILALLLVSTSAFAQSKLEYKQAPKGDYCAFYSDMIVVSKIMRNFSIKNNGGSLDPFTDKAYPILDPIKNCTEPIARQTIVDANFGGYMSNEYVSKEIHFGDLLDELEALMINSYINDGFVFLHAANAKQPNPPFAKKMIQVLDRALSKLPNFQGEVFHGNANMDPKNIKIGQEFRFKSYVSTSTDRIISENFTGGLSAGTIFKIHVKTGKDLSETFNTRESEVLMPRGFKMKVIGKFNEGGRTIVEAEQIP